MLGEQWRRREAEEAAVQEEERKLQSSERLWTSTMSQHELLSFQSCPGMALYPSRRDMIVGLVVQPQAGRHTQ
eukprot:2839025-Rhodomonas_salina.1